MNNSYFQKLQQLRRFGWLMMFAYFKNRAYYTFRKRFMKQRFIEKRIHNYRMILDMNDQGISRTLTLFGTREKDHAYILNKELQYGNVVFDIGANIGYYVLMEANLVGNKGYIYAMEPLPSNVEILKKNIALNNIEERVEVFQMGASNKTGVEKLYIADISNLNTFYPTNYSASSNLTNRYSPSIDISTTTIPVFIDGKRPVDLIRMDIEGYEVEVFEGMLSALEDKSFAPKILFETHRPKYDDRHHSMRKALREMFRRGYYPKIIVSNDHPKGEFINRGYKPETLIHTDGYIRGIYYGISKEDAIEFICDIGFVRAVLLERA